MKIDQLANNKWAFIVCIGVVISWILIITTGERLPYVDTASAQATRVFIVFPALTVVLIWLLFLHKWAETGMTGYQMRMANLRSRGERIKHTLILLSVLPLLTAGFTWTSINFAAWAANLAPAKPFAQLYKVIGKKAVSNKYDIEMVSISSGEKVSLRLTVERFTRRDWNVGDTICAKGKSSTFGMIVESLARDKENCEQA